jgi:uncharacterized protein (TIGR03437 family)
MILQSSSPRTYAYAANGSPQISSVSPPTLPAGAAAAIDIFGSNTNFQDGQVTVGFGTNDVTVRRVWVLTPTHVVANVTVAPNATQASSEVSVISGMQLATQANGFSVQAPRPGIPLLSLPIVNADPSQQTIYPGTGSFASIFGQNLGATTAAVQVTLNDIAVPVLFANGSQVNFQVPPNFPTGPATLKLTAAGSAAFPVYVEINAAPPVITGLTSISNLALANNPVGAGDFVNVLVTGLDPALVSNPQGRLRVTVGGLEMALQQVSSVGPNLFQIQVVLTQSFGARQEPLTVWVDGSSSAPFTITVR